MIPTQRIITLNLPQWSIECLLDRATDVIWLHGGLGSGKTFNATLKHYQWILENPDCQFSWYVEPKYDKIDSVAIPTWRTVFSLAGLQENKHYSFHLSKPQRLILYSGTQTHTVLFQSADRPHLMVGDNIGYFTLDEAGDSKFTAYEKASQRCRAKSATHCQATVCGVPQGMNWFADHADFQGHDTKKNEKSFEVWTEHNAHNLSPGYVDRMMKIFGHNKAKVQAWLHGKFTNFFEGNAYPDFNEELDVEVLEPDTHAPVILTWDNNAPLAWCAVQERWVKETFSAEKRCCVVAESKGTDRFIADSVVDFIAKFDPQRGWRDARIEVDGDAALYSSSVRAQGNSYNEIISILREYYSNVTLRAARHNPSVEMRVEILNKAFSYKKLLINRNCIRTIKSLSSTSWDTQSEKRQLVKRSGDDIPAYSDALGYFIYRWWQSQNMSKTKGAQIIY